MALAKRTADYPEGARFIRKVEVLWAADLFLNRPNDVHRAGSIDVPPWGIVTSRVEWP
jgi:hypothetical protein